MMVRKTCQNLLKGGGAELMTFAPSHTQMAMSRCLKCCPCEGTGMASQWRMSAGLWPTVPSRGLLCRKNQLQGSSSFGQTKGTL